MVSFKKLFGFCLVVYLSVYALEKLSIFVDNTLPFSKENVVCAKQQLNKVKKKLRDDFTLDVVHNTVVYNGGEKVAFKDRIPEPKVEEVHSRLMDYVDGYGIVDVFKRYNKHMLGFLESEEFLVMKQDRMVMNNCMVTVGDLLFEEWSKEVESRKNRLVFVAVGLDDFKNNSVFKWIKSFFKK